VAAGQERAPRIRGRAGADPAAAGG